MQLVQQARLPQSRQSHLAEIFRSDLLAENVVRAGSPHHKAPFNDEAIFDFHEGVRDELLRELSERQKQNEAVAVLEAVENFIATRTGQSGVFSGLIVAPDEADQPDAVKVDELALAFARIGVDTLQKLDVRLDKVARWKVFLQRYDKQVSDDTPPSNMLPELTGLPHPVVGVVPGMSDVAVQTLWEQLNENLVTAFWQITELQRQINALPSVSSEEGELLQKALINKTRLRVTIGERLQEVSNALRHRNLTSPPSPFSLIIQTLIGDFEHPGHATLWSIVGQFLAALRIKDLATAGRQLSALGNLLLNGNVHEAVAMQQLAYHYAQKANDFSGQFYITMNWARACDSYDTYQPSAKPLFAEAVQIAIRLNEPQLQLLARLELAKQQKRLGSDAPALRENYLAALKLARELRDQANESLILKQLGQLYEPFSFDTVTLDERGNVKEHRTLTAYQFVEVLAPDLTLEMVAVPGGTFTMGSPRFEKESYDNERPQHEVTVSPFFMGKFAITQAQWREVAGWSKVERELNAEPSYFPRNKKRTASDDQRPVEQVSWEDAQEFCARLSAKTGRAYRLPTEAEWEYACRAGTTTPFAFGPTITPEYVNYDGNYPYGQAPQGRYRGETVWVGPLGWANKFGLSDMHGNVWEWCQDWYAEDYYQQCAKDGLVADPMGPARGESRVLRGGSWYFYARDCRSADRDVNQPSFRNNYIGFRIVVSWRTP